MVLAIGGHDPGGGAGIQADVEAIAANGCHAATALTCLTVQDSCNVSQLLPIDVSIMTDQINATLDDCRVATIKIGLVGSLSAAQAIVDILQHHRAIPVVFDPVLAAGGGSDLSDQDLIDCMRQTLIPLCRLLTPNMPEAVRLTGSKVVSDYDIMAGRLLDLGAESVLITGSHDPDGGSEIIHRLYQPSSPPILSRWQRLAGEYHGSGCTLTSAIAARMAVGEALPVAVEQGLAYSWSAISQGFRTGRCQAIPERLASIRRAHHDEGK
ncbi:MAG: hydroxymethylpyrimidine/phosphomethylpyrimidine kinase [Candidatus Thiodiazotropha sp. (ex Ctena orbiculata)]|uniref:hydroxymethylpyrimidine kinase n=1 Tax=Candidatus Thiodiazotropha taylori TaxID=2792791 RepID=A0A944QUZ2_9GAMM|nr:hydroxymethylpyrimidine/phosphomethylpyrimidine kinase [Candidatus Thiodiazotropha taylori]PUB84108.1 MAG: hydroxymethylpyrimidine/phosphomethylpyrimidine kinase [gamma proteobacterium symbiont of Ctena orbiculata]MBT2988966.1 hydroxymethylpyrimidine/phosphomethylpyrimidine kinase [Candidatus Thiodiazotropha taylori]MBT2996388.1 hydroxymethylpyrimidine/phosphomethylpyrimidine kinase [Candidatus Thiodiazotropha taylori]MBT3000178.1 hydroxymethylpyrimidine/phosphomethylpyrimidine kinase [Candi